MAVAYFTEAVTSHETRFVDIAIDTDDASLGSVLPQRVVTTIGQYRLLVGVQGNHELVVVELAHQILVVEIAISIDEGLLTIGHLHQP